MFKGLITIVIGNITIVTQSAEPIKLMYIFSLMFFIFFALILFITNLINPNKEKSKTIHLLTFILMAVGFILSAFFYYLELFN